MLNCCWTVGLSSALPLSFPRLHLSTLDTGFRFGFEWKGHRKWWTNRDMDFLLPNGICIPLQMDFYDSMENVKLVIFTKCKRICILLYMYQFREVYWLVFVCKRRKLYHAYMQMARNIWKYHVVEYIYQLANLGEGLGVKSYYRLIL